VPTFWPVGTGADVVSAWSGESGMIAKTAMSGNRLINKIRRRMEPTSGQCRCWVTELFTGYTWAIPNVVSLELGMPLALAPLVHRFILSCGPARLEATPAPLSY